MRGFLLLQTHYRWAKYITEKVSTDGCPRVSPARTTWCCCGFPLLKTPKVHQGVYRPFGLLVQVLRVILGKGKWRTSSLLMQDLLWDMLRTQNTEAREIREKDKDKHWALQCFPLSNTWVCTCERQFILDTGEWNHYSTLPYDYEHHQRVLVFCILHEPRVCSWLFLVPCYQHLFRMSKRASINWLANSRRPESGLM